MAGLVIFVVVYMVVAGLVAWDLKTSNMSVWMKGLIVVLWLPVGVVLAGYLMKSFLKYKAYK